MAEKLAESPGLRPQDLMAVVVETAWENWSLAMGKRSTWTLETSRRITSSKFG
jgi:hypothetical protein